jgi:hypothetical protein
MSRSKIFITDDDDEVVTNKVVNKVVNTDKKVTKEKNLAPLDDEEKVDKEYEDLKVLNNGGISYIVKKYNNKPIISIYHAKKSEKSGLITTKWIKNFFGENQAYLAELGKEKYDYIFIGGSDIYEFSLFPDDTFVSFNCYIGNSSVTYAYIIGKKYTYFLTEKCSMDNSLIKDTKDPYKALYSSSFYEEQDSFPEEKLAEQDEIYFELCDKSKYVMGKPGKDKYENEDLLNDNIDKLFKLAEKNFNDIEKRYMEGMMEFLLISMTKSCAKKKLKDDMDKKKIWAKFRIEYFKTSVKEVEENRVNYMKRCVEEYLNLLYNPETSYKHYCLFLDIWYSSL